MYVQSLLYVKLKLVLKVSTADIILDNNWQKEETLIGYSAKPRVSDVCYVSSQVTLYQNHAARQYYDYKFDKMHKTNNTAWSGNVQEEETVVNEFNEQTCRSNCVLRNL